MEIEGNSLVLDEDVISNYRIKMDELLAGMYPPGTLLQKPIVHVELYGG
jgi:hypothetical protein